MPLQETNLLVFIVDMALIIGLSVGLSILVIIIIIVILICCYRRSGNLYNTCHFSLPSLLLHQILDEWGLPPPPHQNS